MGGAKNNCGGISPPPPPPPLAPPWRRHWLQVLQQLETSGAKTTCQQLVNTFVTTCLQICNNLCVFTCVE